jgi:glycosyltransferase involved in cell wall biosynthesis
LRILYLADIRFPLERANGIQSVETCHALAARGHEVVLRVRRDTAGAARDPLAFYGLPSIPGLHLEYAPSIDGAIPTRTAYVATALARATLPGGPDVVLTRDLGVASALLRIPRALRAPMVYESHGFAPSVSAALPALLSAASAPSASKLARLLRREQRVWRLADGYVTITHALARELEARFGPRPLLSVVPDGVRLPRARVFAPPARHSPPVVGYAGHLYPWKGVDLLVSALMLLPGVHGLIIGGHPREPDLARLRRQAESAHVADRVRFVGFVPPGDVPGYLSQADVLVLPNPETEISRSYSSPLKLFEYMAAGKPIVASNLPAFREVLSAEEAVLVEPGRASALAEGIERVLRSEAFAARLARNAFDAAAQYSWDARAERLDRLLSTVVGLPRPGAAT